MRDPRQPGAGPNLPEWLFSPVSLDGGSRSPYLKFVEMCYLQGLISPYWYDRWTELNSGDYQLGSNDALLKLWDCRLEGAEQATPDWVRQSLLAGLRVRFKAHRGPPGSCRPPTEEVVAKLLEFNSKYFRVVPCGVKGFHVKLYHHKKVSRHHLKVLNQLFPWLEQNDKQKTNLDLASLVFRAWTMGHFNAVAQALSLVTVGATNTMAVGIVISALGNEAWSKMQALMAEDRCCCLTRDGYKKYFKGVSTAVRRTGRWADGESVSIRVITSSAYWELCSGRAANIADPDEEIAKRCGPVLDLSDPYTGGDLTPYLKRHIEAIIDKIMPDEDAWKDWASFVKRRQVWAPAGSASGAKATVEGEPIKVNKQGFYEELNPVEMLAWLDLPPALLAVLSQKMEAGKARAIFGTMPIDQAIVTYLILPLELRMKNVPQFINGHEGILEVVDIAIKQGIVKDPRVECSMLDFADFNYQHTLLNQALLFSVIEERVRKFGNPDLTKAAKWVRDAQLNQKFKVANSEEWHQVTQGMFSGVRSTDFTNTILNLAYFNMMSELVKEHTGLEPINLFNVHKGDDVWISNYSRVWAIELFNAMSKAGFKFQKEKQMFGRGVGEFLRVVYAADGVRGYVMRSVATLVVKPLQSVDDLAPAARGSALTSQIHMLFRRGLSSEACQVLWWATVPHALRLSLPNGGGVGIPVSVASKSFKSGGLDLGPPGTIGLDGPSTQPAPSMRAELAALERDIKRYMSHDYISVISERYPHCFDSGMVEDALHRSNVSGSMRPADSAATIRQHQRQLRKWLDKVSATPGNTSGGRGPLCLGQPTVYRLGLVAELVERSLAMSKETGQAHNPLPTVMNTIYAAIAGSPFRDLNSAVMATKQSILDSAITCIRLTANARRAVDAMRWLQFMIERMGKEASSMALRGIRGVGLSYEAFVNPVILSLISEIGTDAALLTLDAGEVTSQYGWIDRADLFRAELLLHAEQRLSLSDWSHM